MTTRTKSMTIRGVGENGGNMEVTVYHAAAKKAYRDYRSITEASFYRLATLINDADNGLFSDITVSHSLFPGWLSVHLERYN